MKRCGRIIGIFEALSGLVLLTTISVFTFAFTVESNIKPQIVDGEIIADSVNVGMFDLNLKIKDEDSDDSKLHLGLVFDDLDGEIPLVLDSISLVRSDVSTPDINNANFYQIGDLNLINLSNGEEEMNISFASQVLDLPTTLDINTSRLKVVVFDGVAESDPYFINFTEIDAVNSEGDIVNKEEEVVEEETNQDEFYGYDKPLLNNLIAKQIDRNYVEIQFEASGAMDNIMASIEYSVNGANSWEKAAIESVTSNVSILGFKDIGLTDGDFQIQNIHTSLGNNLVNAKWHFSQNLKQIDSDYIYLKVTLQNVIVKSDAKIIDNLVLDNIAPSQIYDLKTTEINTDAITLSWSDIQESHFENGFYKVLFTKDSFFEDWQEYKFAIGMKDRDFFKLSGLEEGETYRFKIELTDDFGNMSVSNEIKGTTNRRPVLEDLKLQTDYDDIGRAFVSVIVSDKDGDVSSDRGQLRLKAYLRSNTFGEKLATISEEISATNQRSVVGVDNSNEFNIGNQDKPIKGTSDQNQIKFFWDTVNDIGNVSASGISFCIKINDFADDGNTLCKENLQIDNTKYETKQKIEYIEEVVTTLEDTNADDIDSDIENSELTDNLQIVLNHKSRLYIETFLSLISQQDYLIKGFYVDKDGEENDFDFYNPDNKIKKLDALRFILKIQNDTLLIADRDVFADVPREHPYSSDILTAVKLGLVNGSGSQDVKIKKFFNAESQINLAEAVNLIAKGFKIDVPVINQQGLSIEYGTDDVPFGFDLNDNKEWYADSFVWAYFNKIIDQNDKPEDIVSIGDFVEMMIKAKEISE